MTRENSILEKVLRKHVKASEEEIQYALQIGDIRKYNKGDHFLTPATVCNKIGFIESGIAMIYRLETDQKKGVMEFYSEGEYITDFYSYIKKEHCLFHIVFLEDTVVFEYEREEILQKFRQSLHWERYGRVTSESAYVKIMQQVYDNKFYNLEERYLRLINDRSELFQRVPLYLIASYLNTTPETISRIRRNLYNNAK